MNDLRNADIRRNIFNSEIEFPGKDIAKKEFINISLVEAWTQHGDGWSQDKDGVFYSNNHRDGSTSAITTSVKGVRKIELDYNVSSELHYDFLRIYINGSDVVTKSGSTGWTHYSKSFENNTDVDIRLQYSKDGSVSRGSDRGYIRNIKLG